MTVKLLASSGATLRHIRWVCGNPCSRRIGDPDPDQRTQILVSPVWTSALPNASHTPDYI